MLTDEQTKVLLMGIRPSRVAVMDGMSYVEGYDVRAMLTRIFGFGMWEEIAQAPTEMLYDLETTTKAGKPAHKVAYKASRRLVIHHPDGMTTNHDGSAVGEATMPDFKQGDTHDMAIKTAETQALKRCAINLGDQFGLSLYKNGSIEPLIRKIVGFDPPQEGTDGTSDTSE